MQKKRILFFGDSGTWGGTPDEDRTLNSWVDILKGRYQDGFEIIVDAMPGRTVDSDFEFEGQNGLKAFEATLHRNSPLDIVFVMLGKNDCSSRFNKKDSKEIAMGFFKYKSILEYVSKYWEFSLPKVVLIAPPKLVEARIKDGWGREGSQLKSEGLSLEIESVSKILGFDFIDASTISVGKDGIHFNERGNEDLANMVGSYLDGLKT